MTFSASEEDSVLVQLNDLYRKVIRPKVRTRGRLALSAALQYVPASVFEPIRNAYPMLVKGSTLDQLTSKALGVARHRGLPQTVTQFSPVDNPTISLAKKDSYIVERLYWYGERKGYEPEVLHWWRRWCSRSTNILEVGANIGYFTVQGSRVNREAAYTAVEPHPGAAASCRQNLTINGIEWVSLLQAAAVGSQQSPPKIRLYLPGGRDHYSDAPCTGFAGDNELHKAKEALDAYKFVEVPTVELTRLIDGVDLLKIDAEGQEYQLLRSVEDIIRINRPTMFLELLDGTPKLRSFISELRSSTPYRCFILQETELLPTDHLDLNTLAIGDYGAQDVVVTCDPIPL